MKKTITIIGIILCICLISGCGINGNSGSSKKLGETICFENECFYVIKYDSSKKVVTALSKNILSKNNHQITESDSYSSRLKLYFYDKKKFESAYWIEVKDEYGNSSIKSKYNNNTDNHNAYPVYVYDNNSLAYEYLENYKNYLNNDLKANITSIRLPSIEDVNDMGCYAKVSVSEKDCESAPEWVYSESYWLGTAQSSINVYFIGSTSDGYVGTKSVTGIIAKEEYIRPVVEISM